MSTVPWYMMLCIGLLAIIAGCYMVEGMIWLVKRKKWGYERVRYVVGC